MTKEEVLRIRDIHERLQQAVEASNLEDKWKNMIVTLSKIDVIQMETRFIVDGGSLR
jgi:hypothetical protein